MKIYVTTFQQMDKHIVLSIIYLATVINLINMQISAVWQCQLLFWTLPPLHSGMLLSNPAWEDHIINTFLQTHLVRLTCGMTDKPIKMCKTQCGRSQSCSVPGSHGQGGWFHWNSPVYVQVRLWFCIYKFILCFCVFLEKTSSRLFNCCHSIMLKMLMCSNSVFFYLEPTLCWLRMNDIQEQCVTITSGWSSVSWHMKFNSILYAVRNNCHLPLSLK